MFRRPRIYNALSALRAGVAHRNNKKTQSKISDVNGISILVNLLLSPPSQKIQVPVTRSVSCNTRLSLSYILLYICASCIRYIPSIVNELSEPQAICYAGKRHHALVRALFVHLTGGSRLLFGVYRVGKH